MKEKSAFALVALIALFALSGCTAQPGGGQVIINDTGITGPIINDTGPVVINATEGCDSLLDLHVRDNCYFNKVSKGQSEEISTCYSIKEDRLRDRCVYLLGIKKIELCAQISEDSLDLRDDCFFSNAESLERESTCFRIRNTTLVEKCQIQIAEKTCAALDEYDKMLCLAVKTKDASRCLSLANESQECLFRFALNVSDTSACNRINNPFTAVACRAIIESQPSYCQQEFTSNTSSDACYKIYAVETNNASICDKTVTTTYIDSCHEALALLNNDPSLCSHLILEADRDKCYYAVGVKYSQPAVCDSIKVNEWRDKCRHDMAVATSTPYFCGFMENAYQRAYACYAELLAPKYQLTLEKCSGIRGEDLKWKDECYLTMAGRLKNSSICDMIATEAIKARCG